MTTEAAKVLVVDDSKLEARITSDALREAGYQIVTAQDGNEALKLVETDQPDAVILDVVMPGMSGYQTCRALRNMEVGAHIPVIMLTASGGIEAKITGFEAGADDYLLKRADKEELIVRLKVLLERAHRDKYDVTRSGQLFSTFSLRGGVGVSSLAVNLAVILSGLWDRDVPLVDLALTMGQIALMFNIKPEAGINDVALREVTELDYELVGRALHRHPTGVRILSAPAHPEEAERVSATHVNALLPLLKDHYPYSVADLASDLQEVTLTTLDHADHILLVLTPELAAVRAAAEALRVFASLGYPADKSKLVLNQTLGRRGLSRKNIETALHRPMDLVIPFAPDLFISSLTKGAPLVVRYPDSKVTTLLEDFTFRLTRQENLPESGERMTPMLARVRKRLGV